MRRCRSARTGGCRDPPVPRREGSLRCPLRIEHRPPAMEYRLAEVMEPSVVRVLRVALEVVSRVEQQRVEPREPDAAHGNSRPDEVGARGATHAGGAGSPSACRAGARRDVVGGGAARQPTASGERVEIGPGPRAEAEVAHLCARPVRRVWTGGGTAAEHPGRATIRWRSRRAPGRQDLRHGPRRGRWTPGCRPATASAAASSTNR